MRKSKSITLATIGIVTLMFFTASEISDTIVQDFFLKTICANLYPNTNVCSTDYNETIKDQIESKTATYISISMYLEKGLPIGISLMAGSWSDIHGRKWLILVSALGAAVTFATFFTLSLIPQFCNKHLWILLLPSIFNAIGGNHSLFMIGMMSHLGDELIKSDKDSNSRTVSFAIIEICAMAGVPLGLLVGSALFSFKGFSITFLTSAIINIFVLILCQFLIPHTTTLQKGSHVLENNEMKISSFATIRRIYNACFRNRKGDLRSIMLLLIGSRLIAKTGEDMYMAIMFVSIEEKFGWSIQDYNKWMASFYGFASIGFLLVTFILNKKIPDPIQSAMGCFTQGIYSYLLGIANNDRTWIMWLSSCFGLLRLLPSVIARSVTSKIACSYEIGSIFSVYSSLEGIIPLIITPLGTSLFNYCLFHHIDTGLVFYCSTVFFAIASSVSLFTNLIWNSNLKYMQNENK